jgi:hypothetical protein
VGLVTFGAFPCSRQPSLFWTLFLPPSAPRFTATAGCRSNKHENQAHRVRFLQLAFLLIFVTVDCSFVLYYIPFSVAPCWFWGASANIIAQRTLVSALVQVAPAYGVEWVSRVAALTFTTFVFVTIRYQDQNHLTTYAFDGLFFCPYIDCSQSNYINLLTPIRVQFIASSALLDNGRR